MNLKPATKDMLLFGALGFACASFCCAHCSSKHQIIIALLMTIVGALAGRFARKH